MIKEDPSSRSTVVTINSDNVPMDYITWSTFNTVFLNSFCLGFIAYIFSVKVSVTEVEVMGQEGISLLLWTLAKVCMVFGRSRLGEPEFHPTLAPYSYGTQSSSKVENHQARVLSFQEEEKSDPDKMDHGFY
ncbi:hypothetical protein STEG23_018280 [Scotinomys teguina]